ncbi:MAG: serine--tRNA ligase [Elusimicrobia bacterium CG_4_9_14_3_um_filter_62_55]|nr:MAG: serine--tRNA ligase [Elusimicrobia bacterium CG22_combo_CG10-13_8_21_14_all_63_91]PJA16152.1 MAG: serine--tRNA ligase [Elusimicrobia bacterium CG_4_10_14_0_2_um_filter_63_34]PJB26326.1 MAG: serine--tRNA ligase [Elusimicrobia bacterium CG_4_9_14_3_um_filter_62_55]
MNDPKLLRKDPGAARTGIENRGGRYLPALDEYLETDKRHRALLQEVEEMRSKRNDASKSIGQAMASGDRERAEALKKEVASLKDAMAEKEAELEPLTQKSRSALLSLPHLPDASVPVGKSEADNPVVREGDRKPAEPGFEAKDHVGVGEGIGAFDFETAAKLSGSRFALVRGEGARLQRAISQLMIDTHTREHGYTEMWVPYIVRPEILEGTGQLPKFEEDLYKTGQLEEAEDGAKSHSYYLIPTAEVPLTNVVRETIVDEADLPMKMTALTPCFRQEAGSHGKDVKGFIRQHQFEKVELVWIVKPEQSMAALESLTSHAEAILKKLELPYRVIELCTADIGFAAKKTYDLEVWLPGEKRWREVSSCSNCGDFQARRMNARMRRAPVGGKKGEVEWVHTLNGSGLAVGRIFVAVLENYQNADGSVTVPAALKPYMGGIETIEAK